MGRSPGFACTMCLQFVHSIACWRQSMINCVTLVRHPIIINVKLQWDLTFRKHKWTQTKHSHALNEKRDGDDHFLATSSYYIIPECTQGQWLQCQYVFRKYSPLIDFCLTATARLGTERNSLIEIEKSYSVEIQIINILCL